MKKIRKTGFNKALYNNALESTPCRGPASSAEINPLPPPFLDKPQEVQGFAFNEYHREQTMFKYINNIPEDFMDNPAFQNFLDKCETEMFNYIKEYTGVGKMLINRGSYKADKYDFTGVFKNIKSNKNFCTIHPNDNILALFHALLEDYSKILMMRYFTIYTPAQEDRKKEMYFQTMSFVTELDNIISPELFTPISALCIDYNYFSTHKKEITKESQQNPYLESVVINSETLFRFHDYLTTEDELQWDKDFISGGPSLYRLFYTAWTESTYGLYIKLLCEPEDKETSPNYYKKKIKNEKEGRLFRASITPNIREATPRIASLVYNMSGLFSDMINKCIRLLFNFSFTRVNLSKITEDSNFKNIHKNFKAGIQNNIQLKLEKELEKEKEEKAVIQKELDDFKKKYEILEKETKPLIKKNKEKEKQHKADLKRIRQLEAEKNKKEKELLEKIELLEAVNKDFLVVENIKESIDFTPTIPEDISLAFCMSDRPGFDKTAKALTEEFSNSTIVHNTKQLTNQDVVIFLTEMLEHSLYYPLKDTANKIGAIQMHTTNKNPKLLRDIIAAYLYKKGA